MSLTISAVLVAVGVVGVDPAYAVQITVASCESGALISAIESANDEVANPGIDLIVLNSGCTYSLTSAYDASGLFGLPTITSEVFLLGLGATIQRAAESPSFGFFSVAQQGSLTLKSTTLMDARRASIDNSGSVSVEDSIITAIPPLANKSGLDNQGTMSIINSTLSNLRSNDGGGAVVNTGALTIASSRFENNRAGNPLNAGLGPGGAIWNVGTASITSSQFTGNVATAGGAIRQPGGTLSVVDSSFVDNAASVAGGAIRANADADLRVERSYFGLNDAFEGGALHNSGSSLATVINSTFFGNRASRGAAAWNEHSLRIEQSTFSDNTGGGATLESPSGLIGVEASIIEGASQPCGFVADFDYNVVYPAGGSCPSGFAVADPRLGQPGSYGGATKTIRLGGGSAAIDRVPLAACGHAVDQRGATRPAGPACDSGALENQIPTSAGQPVLTQGTTPNQGSFTLGWEPSSDLEQGPLTYRVYHKDADDTAFELVGQTTAPVYSFAVPEAEGSHQYRAQASDGNYDSSLSVPSGVVVVDRTPPSSPIATADRPPEFVSQTGDAWYRDLVTLSYAGSADPALADFSPGSGVASYTPPITLTTSGQHAVVGQATDHAGNLAETTVNVRVDAHVPDVGFTSCPADVLLNAAAMATWSVSDAHSGLATVASGVIPLPTSTIGAKAVTISATDNVGHSSSAICNYRVIYDFNGFLKPVVNPPTESVVVAGNTVPVSFGLNGNQGTDILATSYPQSVQITCGTSPDETSGSPTSATRPLLFTPAKAGGSRYIYSWRTQAQWAGTCRQLIVMLADGTYHRANFRFT